MVRAVEQVPASFVAAGRAAFAWREVDAELAALSHDSATAGPDAAAVAGTHAEPAQLRALTFVSSELTIELEVTADALVGQVIPPRPGRIELESPHGRSGDVRVDEVGWFAIRPVPTGPVRPHLRTDDGALVRTEWTTL